MDPGRATQDPGEIRGGFPGLRGAPRRSIRDGIPLDSWNKKRTMFVLCSREDSMVRAVVEEAAALASLALFVGMIAIWAQFIAAF